MPFQAEDIADLNNEIQHTIVGQGLWTDLSLDVQHLTIVERFLGEAKNNVQSGPTQEWPLQIANTGTAKWDELYGRDTTSRGNIMLNATQEWALATGNYTYDLREKWFQTDSKKVIVNHLAVLAHSAKTKALLLIEEALWSAPTSSTARPRVMSGFPFWLPTNASTGFFGGDPTGFSAGAGNVTVAQANGWRPYTGTYNEVGNDSLFSRMRVACRETYFKAPSPYPSATPDKPNWMFYTDGQTYEEVERDLYNTNDDIRDGGKFIGMGMFKGIHWEWVPFFAKADSIAYDTTNPVYGINWAKFMLQFQEGSSLTFKRDHQAMDAGHNVRQSDWDASVNLLCMDRRANFHFYRTAA